MDTRLHAADAAFRRLAPGPVEAESATRALTRWCSEPAFAAYRPLLSALLDRQAWDLLFDGFWRVLPFGTGGRRGPVGIGPNRINPWTLGTSVQGSVEFLRRRFGTGADLSVVIAADVRVFRDLRGAFPAGVDNPLLGLTSVALAQAAACIYAANGVRVFLPDPARGRFVPTPELSFLIRHLGASAGLNVSASHNHPDDNGGKFYTELGAQEVPPHDERMVEIVDAVDAIVTCAWDEALASGRVRFLDDASHEAYLSDALATLPDDAPRGARIVYSNLHGVGDASVGEGLRRAGFDVHTVPEQAAHDGLFPAVKFRAPNPEYESAFDLAIARGKETGADLLLSTDPDADRIGAMGRDPGAPSGYRFFTGNELSALVAEARFRRGKRGGIGIKTEVTSDLFARVVRGHGGRLVGDLLVGCKYIAGVVRALETEGRYRDLVGSADDVLIGTEESHGFLLSRNVRDKDALPPALLLASLASEEKAAGRTLGDALDALYQRHGAVANVQIPLVMQGASGRARIVALQDALRRKPPSQIAGHPVTEFADRQDVAGPYGPIVSETDRAARDVLVFRCGPDLRIVIRPSGTEPKTKIYAEAAVPSGADVRAAMARATDLAEELAADFVRQGLLQIGLRIDEAGLYCSPLLGIDERIAFGERILPEAIAAAERGEDVRALLVGRIGRWGGDGLGMTAPGWRRFRDRTPAGQALAESVRAALDRAYS